MQPIQTAGVVPSSTMTIPYMLEPLAPNDAAALEFLNQQETSAAILLSTEGNTITKQENQLNEMGEFGALLAIMQNQTLSLAQKNMRFACQLKNTQLPSFKNIQLLSEFTTNNLTLAMGSANDGLPTDNIAVARDSLPFYVLDKTANRIDFDKTILPRLLRKEINSDAKIKERAGVTEVATLQEWACGTIRSFKIQLADPLPLLCTDSYSLVTFVPVKEEQTGSDKSVKKGQWDPFFKGAAGPKVVLTYVNDHEDPQVQGGASGLVTHHGKYVAVQDSIKKRHHWSVQTSTEEAPESRIEKIKRAAVNFVIIPLKAVTSPNRESARYSSPERTVAKRQEKALPHKVDAQGTVHIQVQALPIDLSNLVTETDLQRYMKELDKMMLELVTTHAKQIEKPLIAKTLIESVALPLQTKENSNTLKAEENGSIKKLEFTQYIESLFHFVREQVWSLFTQKSGC